MMWWLPIAYVCAINGQCAFAYGAPSATEEKCLQALYEARNQYEAHPSVQTHDGVCVPVKPEYDA